MNNQDERSAELGMELDREMAAEAARMQQEQFEVIVENELKCGSLVYVLIESFGCYVGDVKTNLQIDEETWAEYLDDQRPYLRDLLHDFADRDVCREKFGIKLGAIEDWQTHARRFEHLVERALDQYLGVN